VRCQLYLKKVQSNSTAVAEPRSLTLAMAIVAFALFSFVLPGLSFAEAPATTGGKAAKETNKPVVVTSDTMESLRDERVVIFRGEVVAEQDHLMCSDELRIFYDKQQEVKDIVATGNARIVQGANRAKGDKIVYDKVNGELIITGNAAAIQCGDIVRGEKIIFYLDSDNVMVEGGDKRVRAVIMPQKENKECSGGDTSGTEGHISEEFQCQRAR